MMNQTRRSSVFRGGGLLSGSSEATAPSRAQSPVRPVRSTEFRDEERARRLRWIPQIQPQFQLRTGRAKYPDPGLQTSGRERTAPRSRERGFDRYENRWETASRPPYIGTKTLIRP